jgi:lysophospholipase L1-like esterase
LKRKFSVTGTESLIGDYPLSLTIYDDNLNPLFSKSVTLKIVSTLSTQKSICPIGDSLTNGKHWLNEVRTLSSNKISFVGTRGTIEGLKHEGRSGFSSNSYLTATAYSYENEGIHPFWDSTNSCFSWGYYKNTSGLSPDAVQIYLGTNDFAGNVSADVFANNIKQMVDSVREKDANLPIFVVLTICWGNQNGIGSQISSDGFASQKGRFKYDLDRKTINGVKALYEALKSYTNVYFVPLTECHDSEYNFGSVEVSVNPRASQKEYIPTEGVHPQQQGYEQMADVMYSVYCRALS